MPGFIDAHMHLESSKLLVDEFARLVLPFGTTAVVADPHEIANVLGTDGVHWLLDATADLPLDVYFMASSCVPASHFESPRRTLSPGDLDALLRRRRVIGLAEMMNFPGVISGSPAELAKLALAEHVDGHAPGVLGKDLNAYAAAGIRSDHEAYTPEEGLERLRAGLWLLIREGSAARNLHALLPLLAEYGPSRIAFCTDDREPEHIADDGHINSMVRDAVAFGIPVEDALVCATLSPALWHGLAHLGAVAPGYHADLLVLPDLERFVPETVLKRGTACRRDSRKPRCPTGCRHTMRIGAFGPEMFRIPWSGGAARVIGIVPGQIVTDSLVDEPGLHAGEAIADADRDLAKIAVVERHLGTGRVGLGFVRGFGLAPRRDRLDRRARRPQRRGRRHERRVDGGGGPAAREPRRRHRRRRRRRGARRAAAAGRRACSRTRRSTRSSRHRARSRRRRARSAASSSRRSSTSRSWRSR